MAVTLDDKLVVAISSRALFDFEEENRLFDPDHPQSYMQLQLDRLDVPARPGVAFSLVKKLLAFNEPAQQRVEVVVLSRNDPVSGMRVFRSASSENSTASPSNAMRTSCGWAMLAWADCVATWAAGKPMARASFTSAALAERNRCAPRGRR